MSNESKNEGNATNASNNNNKIAELAEENAWKYVKQLHEDDFPFFGENDLKTCKNMFASGFITCATILEEKIKNALSNLVRYEYPDDPWNGPNSVSVLTEEEIKKIVNKVFC